MRNFAIHVNDIDYTEQCRALSYSDHVGSIGRFDARIEGVHNIKGFQTVKIYDDGVLDFQGRVESPTKENVPSGSGMPIGGPEWTARLRDYLTNNFSMDNESITNVLTEILTNSPYALGTIDAIDQIETEMKTWDTTLEFLQFDFNDICIVYNTVTELEDELGAGTFELAPSNRRSCFWDHSTGYFFIVVYDNDNSLLKYNSTSDFATWKGWTSLGFDKGDDGDFGLTWDEANGRLFLVVYDGANIDYYRYSSAGGTLTQQDTDDDVCAGNIVCGPVLDSSGDIWIVVEDSVEADYELWEFDYSTSTWAEKADWATADNDIPKYMFRGEASEDVIVIMWDDDNNDLDEWLWDQSGTSFAYVRKVSDINNTDCGYVCGFQDEDLNMHLIWEDEIVADGDADLYHSMRDHGSTAWDTSAKIVDDADYQTMNQFQLSGDYSGTLYLFYINDDGATQSLKIVRRFEESWDSAVTLNSSDVDASSQPRSPENGQCLAPIFLDSGEDIHAYLMSAKGLALNRWYRNPDENHSYESGLDFDSTNEASGVSLTQSSSRAYTARYSLRAETPAYTWGGKQCYGIYDAIGDYDEIWVRMTVRADQIGNGGNGDRNEILYAWCGNGATLAFSVAIANQAGTDKWRLRVNEGGVWTDTYGAVANPVEDTWYRIEVYWKKDNAAGECILYVNEVEHVNRNGIDTQNGLDPNIDQIRVGLYSEYCDNDSLYYIDDVAWASTRVGRPENGTFDTDAYTASGDMIQWGSLESTDIVNWYTLFQVWDTTPVALTAYKNVGFDMEVYGVANTDDPITIRGFIEDTKLTDRVYIYDIKVSEKQGSMDLDGDFERCSTAIQKAANIVAREYKLRWNDALDFLEQLGENKSDYIILKTAKSASVYPDVPPNCIIVHKEEDFDSFANAVKVLGYGDYPTRYEGSAQDEESQEEYGIHWIPITNKDCVSSGMCTSYAQSELSKRKDPVVRLSVEIYDDYDAGDICIGDTITIVDEETDLNQTARIISYTKSWDASGRKMTLELVTRAKAETFIEYLAKIQDLERWI